MFWIALLACKPAERPADFTVRPGVEMVSVLDARPGETLTLTSSTGEPLITMITDDLGQAHFSYVGTELLTIDTRDGVSFSLLEGGVVEPGTYSIESDSEERWSGSFEVLAVDDTPDPAMYDQTLRGVPHTLLEGTIGDPATAFQYLEMRDGTLLSAKVRFPDPAVFGPGPYPTVIEYSGYSPSRPDRFGSGQQIPNALGYATVGVNMRGSGCSGGVFDVFNRAQHADGYDIVEIVARQDWVLNNQVGMVGLSYPGISQLYVASTNPPSLAAVVPLSVIADAWEMQWPGGIRNSGFTRQWLEQRDTESSAEGTSWVAQQIETDSTCAENLSLSSQNIDFETFLGGLDTRPEDAGDRDLRELVRDIEAPVFMGGAFQDEQTGAQFARMIDDFDNSPHARFRIYNGRHPDGYAPNNVFHWFEFLEFHVAERVPELPGILRFAIGADTFGGPFGLTGFSFPDDRFAGMDYEAALAAYQNEPAVTVVLEAGHDEGSPLGRSEHTLETWPPVNAPRASFWPAADGILQESAPSEAGADTWRFDADAGSSTFFGPRGYQLLTPLWDLDWTDFAEGEQASYRTAAFTEDRVLSGPGVATVWVESPEPDVTVQVSLTEIRSDGNEVLVQSGWLRLGHRAGQVLDDGTVQRSFSPLDFEDVPIDTWVEAAVEIPTFIHPFRAGSRLEMTVSSPGRNHGTWEFDAPDYSGTPTFKLGRGGENASFLELFELDLPVTGDLPTCPSLRGQPCRPDVLVPNHQP